ncbi:hypothetical protein PanWU01x14_064870 [Parasponia andersonii]|uniref:Uncharacterized protein n=1 Tax=Parasponia andersonii TaxID=3476 RepID=A0A2P5DGK5_PARAD|nr:hypothetical protein PanWU01x14_064870 [Parasponia andersonii]
MEVPTKLNGCLPNLIDDIKKPIYLEVEENTETDQRRGRIIVFGASGRVHGGLRESHFWRRAFFFVLGKRPERVSSSSSIRALDDNDDDSAALTTRETPTTRCRAKFQGRSFSSLDSLEEFLLIK